MKISTSLFSFSFCCLFVLNALLYAQEIEQPTLQPKSPIARGLVFIDSNQDGNWNESEPFRAGVKISNGIDIVETDSKGRYEIPLPDDSILFLIKPTGYRTALDENNLPKFFYLHKPDGSPRLRYPGSKPTGNLPTSINFPLYPQDEPEEFKVILFGDPQPRNDTEVDYIREDVIDELVEDRRDSSFGVSLGDLAFDNLDTLEPLNQAVALIGIPWYNVIGNHDINYDAKDRKHVNETFERVYGPSYYSFDYGAVHFVVLDNIDWQGPNEQFKQFHYEAGFGSDQLAFLKKDLALIPEDQMVVLMMHIPIVGTKDRLSVYELIQDRPFCLSISGHTHMHQHMFIGPADGFLGKQEHHHIINVTVSGSWWSGTKDERGIPHATMQDGGPNGYTFLTFNKNEYRLDYKAAGRPASEQMRVTLPRTMAAEKVGETDLWVNVYNGSEKSTVEMNIDGSSEWTRLEKTNSVDPHYARLAEQEKKIQPPIKPELNAGKISSHLWTGKLSANLSPGVHLLRVRTTDMHGRTYHAHRSLRVTE